MKSVDSVDQLISRRFQPNLYNIQPGFSSSVDSDEYQRRSRGTVLTIIRASALGKLPTNISRNPLHEAKKETGGVKYLLKKYGYGVCEKSMSIRRTQSSELKKVL